MYEKSLRKRFDRTLSFFRKSWNEFTSLEAFHPPMTLLYGVKNEKRKKRILIEHCLA